MNIDHTKVRPHNDFILVDQDEVVNKTESGLFIASTDMKANTGTVIAVGPGKFNAKGERETLTVKPGDRVVYGTNVGEKVKMGDKEYIFLTEAQLFGII